ncbi:MAG: hypothetical protein O2817_07995 [Proteobacteria bacterium]|nr:hypothetical protein [Pseudomonadota bacterium]
MSDDKIKLSDISRELKTPYQNVYLAAVDGRIPVERDKKGSRWVANKSDLPAIAAALGLSVNQEAGK